MKKFFLIVAITTILFLILDFSNFFKTNIIMVNMDTYFWVFYILFVILIYVIYDVNRKRESALNKDLKMQVGIIEKELEVEDEKLILDLYKSGIIREITLWVRDIDKYSSKLKTYSEMGISNINGIYDFKKIFELFMLDIYKMYKLYEDLEIINLYVKSTKYKIYYSRIKSSDIIRIYPPKFAVTKTVSFRGEQVKVIKALREVRDQESYVKLVMEVRNTYYNNLLKVIKRMNRKEKYEKNR